MSPPLEMAKAPNAGGAGPSGQTREAGNLEAQDSTCSKNEQVRHGATPEDWDQFSLMLGLTRDLLPVVSHPEAAISPKSSLQSLGKTPSVYNSERQVVGITGWTQKEANMALVEAWSRERDYGICIQTREVRALDVDIEDPEEASRVYEAVLAGLDRLALPRRYRANSAKFLLAFRMPGDFGKRRIKTAHGVIEFLATGQQFVAVGRHPSGVKYEWTWPDECYDFPTLSVEAFEALWAALQSEFGVEPSTESSVSRKLDKLHSAAANDPVAQHLYAQGWVKRQERDGRLHITCPWEHEHTTDTGDSSTTYWPAHTGGYQHGHFRCLHAHCEHRTDDQFLSAIGYQPPGLLDGLDGGGVGRLFEDLTLRTEDVQEMEDAEFLVPDLIIRGHVAAYPAPPNGGKTAIFVHLCEQLAADGYEVYYFNVDGSPGDLKRHYAHAQQHGYRVIAPDARVGKSIRDAISRLKTLAAGAVDLRRTVIILDTLKKFVEVINKKEARDFYALLRALSLKGMTVCLLAHTNKYPGEDGKTIFEGTGDLRADVDDLIYFDVFRNEGSGQLEVTTRPDKVRGTFNPRSFLIDLKTRAVTDAGHVIPILAKESRGVLDAIKQAIADGQHSQQGIVAAVEGLGEYGAKKIREVLKRHASENGELGIRVVRTGRAKDLHYELVDPLSGITDLGAAT